MTYTCTQCRGDFPRDAFGNHVRGPNGRNPICKSCKADRQRRDRSTEHGREVARAASARARAKRKARAARELPASN